MPKIRLNGKMTKTNTNKPKSSKSKLPKTQTENLPPTEVPEKETMVVIGANANDTSAPIESASGITEATQNAITASEAATAPSESIVQIPHTELHSFKGHPFQLRDDADMKSLVTSVKERCIDQPALVRPCEDGGY